MTEKNPVKLKLGKNFHTHNLFKYRFLINFMTNDENQPEEGKKAVEEKAEDLEEQQ